MWRFAVDAIQSTYKTFANAHALVEHFGPDAHREALLRAMDPLAIDDPVAKRHWLRVAVIIAWRTGQDEYEDIQGSRTSFYSTPLRRS